MTDEVLDPALFSLFTSLVEERSGIHYRDADNALFTSKLHVCAAEAGFVSPLDYYYFLRYDDPDLVGLDKLVESMTVGETYFMRERRPLEVALDQFVVPRIQRGERPSIWCAASATGEEPYSIAMLLEMRGVLGRVDILATDINATALARAQRGVYGERSFRLAVDDIRARFFVSDGNLHRIVDPIRQAVQWRRVNLVDHATVRGLGPFDLIACRNVLIYFSDDVVRAVASSLGSRLKRDGRLLIGAAESLLRFGTVLHCEEHAGSFFYASAR